MRFTRKLLVAMVAAIAVVGADVTAFASVAAAGEPVRHGMIVVAARPTNGLGPMPGCRGVPDCLAWSQVCSRPVPRNQGLTASIVDVRRLAGLPQERRFTVTGAAAGIALYSGVTVEFWDSDCRSVRVRGRNLKRVISTNFVIPADAAWMTVTSTCEWVCMSFNGVALRWSLT